MRLSQELSVHGREAVSAPLYKVVGQDEDPLPERSAIRTVKSKEAAAVIGDDAVLIGGTAWVFSRDEMVDRFDYLFIDEAGQVSEERKDPSSQGANRARSGSGT